MKLNVLDLFVKDYFLLFFDEAAHLIPSKPLNDSRPQGCVYSNVHQNEEDNEMHLFGTFQSIFQIFCAHTFEVTRRDCFSHKHIHFILSRWFNQHGQNAEG